MSWCFLSSCLHVLIYWRIQTPDLHFWHPVVTLPPATLHLLPRFRFLTEWFQQRSPGNQMPSLHLNAVKQLPWHFAQTFNVCLSLSSLPEIKQKMWTPAGGSVEEEGRKHLSWSFQNVTAQSITRHSIWGAHLSILKYRIFGQDDWICNADRQKKNIYKSAFAWVLPSVIQLCILVVKNHFVTNFQAPMDSDNYIHVM